MRAAAESGSPARRSRRRVQRLTEGDYAQAPIIIAGLKREIPPYAMMSEEGLDIIEDKTEELLQEVGIDFRGDEPALEIWREAGADVKGERVRFDRGHVRDIITRTTPSTFIQHARNPERSVVLGGDNIVFAPAYGSPFVSDLDNGRRYGTLEDFQNLIKLAYL